MAEGTGRWATVPRGHQPDAPPAAEIPDPDWIVIRRRNGVRQRYRRGPGPWCGTTSGYANHRCTCLACADAWRDYCRDYETRHPEARIQRNARAAARRRAAGMTERPPRIPDPRCPIGYGSDTGYSRHHCRCPICKQAKADYDRNRYQRRKANA